MLTSLTVENYALIESLTLAPDPSLNIVTGETGAGKSILLGALGLLLGSRADASAIMDKGRNCVVEGHFDVSGYGLEEFFARNDVDYEPQAVIRRVISPQGKSRAYVNDLPVQLQFLKELGSHLIDIHSQNQSQRIADEAFRLQVVDGMAAHGDLAGRYGEVYARLKAARAELEEFIAGAEKARAEQEWLRHQVAELDAAAFAEGEQQELERSLDELAHGEEIQKALAQTAAVLGRDDDGVLVVLKQALQGLERVAGFYPQAGQFTQRLRSVREELKDMEREVSAGADRIESDPAALERTEQRLGLLFSLLKKHGAQSLDELLEIHRQYAERLGAMDSSAEKIEALGGEISRLEDQARELAARLTAGRRKAAAAFEGQAAAILSALGMPGAVFTVELTPSEGFKPTGCDNVRFLFSGNGGVDPAPVEKIASGGEMSRVMLAIKSIAARSRRMPTMIFDEIDAGVSGRIADAMGEIINELAAGIQVINITHLPQVAAKGDCHFFVYKENSRTAIRKLDAAERVEQIARMLSGSEVTDAALRQAAVLLGGE